MSDTQNEKQDDQSMDGGFVSAYDDNKDSRGSAPQDAGLIVPDHTDVEEDDSAEPEDADVTHQASVEDVDTTPGAEVSE